MGIRGTKAMQSLEHMGTVTAAPQSPTLEPGKGRAVGFPVSRDSQHPGKEILIGTYSPLIMKVLRAGRTCRKL